MGERIQKDFDLRQRYEATIKVDLDNHHVCKIETHELKNTKFEPQWYLPHHQVINPIKPEKVRRVCHAASKYKGVALNDKLMCGTDLLQNLVGIISRFREHEIAMTAEIEAMFLQVKGPPAGCEILRYLWRKAYLIEVEGSENTST